jgi:hypothetical protein
MKKDSDYLKKPLIHIKKATGPSTHGLKHYKQTKLRVRF